MASALGTQNQTVGHTEGKDQGTQREAKTETMIAAGLSFLFFLIGGLCCILSKTPFAVAEDAFPLTAVGFFLVGTAFFVGPMLLVAAEKFS